MVWPFDSSSSTPQQQPKDTKSDEHSIPVKPYKTTQPSQDDEEDNPFIVFRRFADDQFRLLAQGLSTIPSILTSLEERGSSPAPSDSPSRWSDASFTSRASQPLAFMSQHFEPPLSPPAPASPEALAATRSLLVQSRNALGASGVRPTAILDLFRDVETAPPYPFDFYPHDTDGPVWLSVDWFKRSRYSPTQCETDPHLHQHGSMWRAAFEDLMGASLGAEMRAREAWTGQRDEQGLYEAWAQTSRDWMLGLMCRGVVPPLLPGLYRLPDQRVMDRVWKGLVRGDEEVSYAPARGDFWDLVREVGWFDGDEREEQMRMIEKKAPETEMDAYERFLGKANGRDMGNERREEFREQKQVVQQDVPKSRILSTLSTTEKTTLPDGTVTTKVVLKKRFSDGREESTETVSTTHSQGHVSESSRINEEKPAIDDAKREGGQGQKKGWFWG
ncbi:hypothetical protein B9Z65_1904 [Elsinoe australis]|uniref:Uncharacterized protein n=1 Tax=Elsinoe australis TaxID=40998 RepID=A0A2P7YL64_9PEZI|nr:hypothetical protein B9Z65_1904 [Elsinoe australis]